MQDVLADSQPSDGGRLDHRDRMLLGFLAEHRLVLESQLQRLTGTCGDEFRRRLDPLLDADYVRVGRLFDERHYQIRATGLTAIDSALPTPRGWNLGLYKHDVGVAWLWLAAHGGLFGPLSEVLGERRLRSHDGALDRASESYGVRLGGFDRYGKERLNYPDLLLIDQLGRRLALELELTPKGRERREAILGGYGADSRIDSVLYLVEDNRRGRRIGRGIDESADQMGLSDRVRVQLIREFWQPSDEPDQGAHRATPARRATTAARRATTPGRRATTAER